MSESDSDMVEAFKAMKEHKKSYKEEQLVKNMEVLDNSRIIYTLSGGYHVMVHLEGKPFVSFYPSSSRWVVRYEGRPKTTTLYGDAEAFLNWYKKQVAGVDGKSCVKKG